MQEEASDAGQPEWPRDSMRLQGVPETGRGPWSGRGGSSEFKRRNPPGVQLGSCSQRMPLNKDMVSSVRPETRPSKSCQTALRNETTMLFSLSVPD